VTCNKESYKDFVVLICNVI